MIIVRNSIAPAEVAEAWAWKTSLGYEFHGPRDKETNRPFYRFYGRGPCCKYAAKFQGWNDYLDAFDLWDASPTPIDSANYSLIK